MLEQEKSKNKSKPTLLELGNIGSRFFAFSIYYNDDMDDVPISVRELIPTISPVRLDLMAKTGATATQSSTTDLNSTYLKAAQVYDDGSIKAKYFAEAIREDEGIASTMTMTSIKSMFVNPLKLKIFLSLFSLLRVLCISEFSFATDLVE
ncbi:MAG TPA: hypothetical protein VFJ05_06690 [Nitrososphaeraceae archaeon]|nr:hypothetical protein [Nitrososphaeraceae archaeon]